MMSVAVSPDVMPNDCIEVGVVGGAYGVHGWVKIYPHAQRNQGSDALCSAKRWWLIKHHSAANGGKPEGQAQNPRCVTVLEAKVHSGAIVAQLAECSEREAAQALKGLRVFVRRADFPALANDEYYWVDLIGLEVVNRAGVMLGKVSDLIDNSAHAVLRIAYSALNQAGEQVNHERLIPFVGAYIHQVDLAGGKILVDWDLDY
ncbi:Ribosome maturation factor RimM [Mycoavidus cysteinexigens]|uniref:Ribosome maturation factor RimM n=1 Tax=Mycoavidus cysteinexigens TaxID=1553431 RepID=A0A2Z6EU69_9BURK|nr:ribosome maturation factor RimM [Mycoavidus cysteinexigens]BBE08993.1 Ribosome maturation factor RimM [Mycoavidus cysteinexigens]GAM52279.1 16S rRNA processing protein RimM [bacterium endosymbiont of Mortierella elongata FMR23-6]GLR01162.1 ribosome maturation factor RimM [Mycoavidus cysteinexigens]